MGFSKLIKNFHQYLISIKETIKLLRFFGKNEVARSCASRCIHKKPTVILSSLYGIFLGPKKEHDYIQHDNAENEMVHNITLASVALEDGNFGKAENILEKTLKSASEKNHQNGIICIYDMLATIALTLHDYDKAEEFLIRVIDRLLRHGAAADDNLVINFSLRLSRVYSDKGDSELADLGYKNCLLNQRKKIRKGDLNNGTQLLLMNILYWYGKFLFKNEKYEEARKCLEECYEIDEKTKQLEPYQLMVVLYHLGNTCHLLGENEDAIKYVLSAISLDRRKNNPDLSYYYSKLGLLYMEKKLYKEAKFWCERGRKAALRYRNKEAVNESDECLEKLNKFMA